MKTKCELLNLIQKYDFALYDLQLYLDTHTQCQEALKLFRKYSAQRKAAVEEYVRRFGPIKAVQSVNENVWDWAKGPYPWEREAN